MKKIQKRSPLRTLLRGACAASLFAALAPQAANAATAGSAANAKILNVVTVTYYDATGNNQHQAATSTSITVALKQAALTLTTGQPFSAVDSGATSTTFVGLTANANGKDSYNVALTSQITNLTDPVGHTVVKTVVNDINGTPVAFTGTVSLGATSIVSVADGATGTQVLSVPAGTVSANGIGVGSTVVINGTSYKVTGYTDGVQAGYTVTGASTGTGSKTDETLGTITIAADYFGAAPALATGSSLAGTLVAERKYLQIADSARVSSNTADGSEKFTVDTDTTTGSNPSVSFDAGTAVFYYTQLSIDKAVANVGSGSGKPGDLLEYTITVKNTATNGSAAKVAVADAVPAYTTLVSFPTGSSYGSGTGTGAATDIFATVYDGSTTSVIRLDSASTDPTNSNVAFGGTDAAKTGAGTAINFYLGAGALSGTGGTVAAQKTYTIKYQVKIN